MKQLSGSPTNNFRVPMVGDIAGDFKSGQVAYDSGVGFWMGNDAGTTKFSIGDSAGDKMTWDGNSLDIAGSLTATSGTIGGFTIGATTIAATNLTLDSSGQRITLGSGNDIVILDADDTTYRIWVGNTNPILAPFKVEKDGSVIATDIAITSGDLTGTLLNANSVDTVELVDGAVVTDKINAGAVTADKITVSELSAITADLGDITAGTIVLPSGGFVRSGQTAYDTGTGFWLGNDAGTPKFSIGNSAGDSLTWDGSSLDITGNLIADSGTIGGFTIGSTTITATNLTLDSSGQRISLGSSNNIVILDADDASFRLWVGNATGSSAPFRVSPAGALTASNATITGTITSTAGTIGGFTLSSGALTASNLAISSSGQSLTLGSSNDIVILDADDSTYRIWVGNATAASAPFRVTKAGAVTATNITITGGSVLTSLLSGLIAQANLNVADRGWSQTSAFSVTDADTVAWAAGTFTSADGTAYSIGAGNTGNMAAKTYIYLDTAVSTTAYQTTTTATTAVGVGKVLIAIAQNGTGEATYTVLAGQGGQNIDAASIVAGSITANEIAASTITAGKLSVAELSTITADMGDITAGTITLDTSGHIKGGQTAYDTGNGFWLGKDSGFFKFSIGDSTGNNLTYNSQTGDLDLSGDLDGNNAANINGIVLLSANEVSTSLISATGLEVTTEFGVDFIIDDGSPLTIASIEPTGLHVDVLDTTGLLTSGTYTPTATAVTNVDSCTGNSSQYMRVGDVVTVSGSVNVNPTASGAVTNIRISLPIASNFSAAPQAGGGAAPITDSSANFAVLSANSTNDAIDMDWIAGHTANRQYFFHFTYRII